MFELTQRRSKITWTMYFITELCRLEVISCFKCLSLSTTSVFSSSFVFNFPVLSSESKSLLSPVTAEILKDMHHFKGALDDYPRCSIPLWSIDVMICLYKRWLYLPIDPHGDYAISVQRSVQASYTQSPWGSRHIMSGGNTAGWPA